MGQVGQSESDDMCVSGERKPRNYDNRRTIFAFPIPIEIQKMMPSSSLVP